MPASPSFVLPDVVAEPERCVRRLGLDCSACTDACPAGAVSLASGSIMFDEHACDSCGACRAVCPSETFGLRTADGIHEIRCMEDERISIGCSLGGCGRAAASVPCYALLSEAEVLYLLAGKDRLEFSVEGCPGCRYDGPGMSGFHSMLGRVRTMLKDPDRLQLSQSASWHGLSRRSFLRRLTRTAEDLVFRSLRDGVPHESPSVLRRRMRTIGLASPGIDPEAAYATVRLAVGDGCSGCGGCATACPLGALDAGDGALVWWAATCTNCDACVVACPEAALSYGGTVTVRESLRPMSLKSFDGHRCPTCGRHVDGDGGLCDDCDEKEALYLQRGFDLGIC